MRPKLIAALFSFIVMSGLICLPTYAEGLSIEHGPTGKPYLSYDGEPLFAFGPADEARTLSNAADLERWAAWQKDHGMNLIRAYPTSVPAEVWGTPCEHQPFLKAEDGEHWDVDQFNPEYFAMLRDNLARLEEHDIVVHLQLWQIVFFKGGSTRWVANYLNPNNNVNDWTESNDVGGGNPGRGYIDAPADSRAREHQREWVTHILDAAKGRSNIMIDVMNELGNAMGDMDWAVEVVRWIREWEAENDWQFLVGVDSEHHYTPERFGPYQEHFDIIMLNELQSPAHARQAFDNFQKPIVSVRPSDGRNHRDDYMFLDESQVGPEHQTRYRTLSYRSMFSNLQSIGCYWKTPIDRADYRDMEFWPVYAEALRTFWNDIKDHWPELVVDDDIVRSETVTPHAYGMRAPALHLVYLECGSHTWDNHYDASEVILKAPANMDSVNVFDPSTGEISEAEYTQDGDSVQVVLPAFVDDLVVILRAAL